MNHKTLKNIAIVYGAGVVLTLLYYKFGSTTLLKGAALSDLVPAAMKWPINLFNGKLLA